MAIKPDKKFLAIFAAVFIIFLIASFYYYHKTVQEDDSISWVDFRVYYYAGLRLPAGGDIYDESYGYFMYKYSPIFALFSSVIRFSTIALKDALCVWYLILFIAFLLCLYLIKEILFNPETYSGFRFFDIVPFFFIFGYLVLINFTRSYVPADWPVAIKIYFALLLYVLAPLYVANLFLIRGKEAPKYNPLVIGLAVLFVLRFVILNINRAQVNIVILLLLLFFTYYLVRKKSVTSGIYLGIAMIIKLTPVIFLVYLLIKKKLKIFFSSVATFVVLLFIPSFKWGIERNTELIRGWAGALRKTFPSEYIQHKNQSLMAAISRLFSKNSDIAIIGLDQAVLTGLIIVVYALAISLLLYVVLKKGKRAEKEESLYDLALFFAAMTILSPVGTKMTFVYMLLPVALLIKEAFKNALKDKVLNTGLLVYVSLVYLNSSDILGDLSTLLHKYSLMTVSLLLIAALLIHSKFKGQRL